ncbi:hypothetical protein GEMRC1_006936 [Eukaryota sp. GEM-RC1]
MHRHQADAPHDVVNFLNLIHEINLPVDLSSNENTRRFFSDIPQINSVIDHLSNMRTNELNNANFSLASKIANSITELQFFVLRHNSSKQYDENKQINEFGKSVSEALTKAQLQQLHKVRKLTDSIKDKEKEKLSDQHQSQLVSLKARHHSELSKLADFDPSQVVNDHLKDLWNKARVYMKSGNVAKAYELREEVKKLQVVESERMIEDVKDRQLIEVTDLMEKQRIEYISLLSSLEKSSERAPRRPKSKSNTSSTLTTPPSLRTTSSVSYDSSIPLSPSFPKHSQKSRSNSASPRVNTAHLSTTHVFESPYCDSGVDLVCSRFCDLGHSVLLKQRSRYAGVDEILDDVICHVINRHDQNTAQLKTRVVATRVSENKRTLKQLTKRFESSLRPYMKVKADQIFSSDG